MANISRGGCDPDTDEIALQRTSIVLLEYIVVGVEPLANVTTLRLRIDRWYCLRGV